MDVCKGCAFEFAWTQESTSVPDECKGCQMIDGNPSNYRPKSQTNADRIRAMTDEELCAFLHTFNVCDTRSNSECKFTFLADCQACVLEWLKQPAEGDA